MFGFKFGARVKPRPGIIEGEIVIVRLNARLQPVERGEHFEDPVDAAVRDLGIGQVTGGGTHMADEPAGIAFCDIELALTDTGEAAVASVIAALEELGAPKGSKLIFDSDGREIDFGKAEGMAVFLNGTDLPDAVYEKYGLDHAVDAFNRLMGPAGQFRGHWQGSRETGLYCYGPSFDAMKAAIAPFLATEPLCAGARVERIA